jgi:IclR family acetate operon transcriptional repressor
MSTVVTSLRVFEEIARRQPVRQAAIAFHAGISPATVHRAVQALYEAGWILPTDGIAKLPRGRPAETSEHAWVVSSRISALLGNRYAHLLSAARPVIDHVREMCNESVSLSVLEGNDVVIIDHLDSEEPLRVVAAIGYRVPAHTAAVGKAILARLPTYQQELFINRQLQTFTESTITDPDQFRAELEEVRRRGYATMKGEYDSSISSVGAAVLNDRDEPIAGVGISGPTERYSLPFDFEDLGELAVDAAENISGILAGRVDPALFPTRRDSSASRSR